MSSPSSFPPKLPLAVNPRPATGSPAGDSEDELHDLLSVKNLCVDELRQGYAGISNRTRDWTFKSPLVAAVLGRRKDFLEALVSDGFSINSVVTGSKVSLKHQRFNFSSEIEPFCRNYLTRTVFSGTLGNFK